MARIVAIAPPGSMDRVVSDLRAEIFARWGAVSALALPSWIPLRSWHLDVPAGRAAAILAGCALAASFELECYARHRGCLFLRVRCPEIPEIGRRLDAAMGQDVSRDETCLVPPYPGFLLAASDLALDPASLERLLPIPAERRFRSYGLCVCGIHTGAPPERWWDLVSWEEEVRVAVKTSGRPSAGSAAR